MLPRNAQRSPAPSHLARAVALGLRLGWGAAPACHGCHADGPCRGDTCVCEDADACGFECGVDGCFGACRRLDTCDAACPDDCTLECADVSQCALGCDDACAIDCQRASRCDVACGEDCHVECSDAGTCEVEMISGTVVCARVGACEVTCVGARPEAARILRAHAHAMAMFVSFAIPRIAPRGDRGIGGPCEGPVRRVRRQPPAPPARTAARAHP